MSHINKCAIYWSKFCTLNYYSIKFKVQSDLLKSAYKWQLIWHRHKKKRTLPQNTNAAQINY